MEREYYGRACRIVLDLYPLIYRDCLQKQLPPSDCQKAADGIRQLRPAQLNVTKNVASRGDYGECNMPLMYILLSCCCGSLPSPTGGWGNSPITGTGIGDDIKTMMSAYKEILALLSSESFSALEYWRFLEITKEICTRLDTDTINAMYVTKSFSESYIQRLETLNNQSMQQTEQDEYIGKMRKIQEENDLQEKEKVMEREYYGRACRIVLDLYPTIYRDCLQKQLPPSDCQTAAEAIRQLRPAQLNVTKNVAVRGDYGECEMPLMYILLSCCCMSLPSPKAGWRRSPIIGTGIGDDMERMMSTFDEILTVLSSESISVLKCRRYLEITKEICTRLDTINAIYVTKSLSESYVQRLETLNSQSMQQTEQDEYIEKMSKIQEEIDHQNKEKDNFYRLSRIIMDLFSNFYHDILQHHTPPSTCPSPAFLNRKIKPARLFLDEESVLKDVPRINSYKDCDIGLMYKVLRNACSSLPVPTAGWNKPVPPTAYIISDDIERIREIRNKAFGHISSTPVSEGEYHQYVLTATDICNRMDSTHTTHLRKSVPGTYQDELNKILKGKLDTEIYRSYLDALATQAKREEDILKTVTTIGRETQHSISLAERNIAKKITEDGSETRNEMKTLDEKLTGITTDHHMETQQSISRAEGNIAKRITEDGSGTRDEMKTLDEKLTGITTDNHMENQQSLSLAERNIVQTITEVGSETRNEMKTLDEKLTAMTTDHHMETQQSLSRTERNIAQTITVDRSETRQELKSLDDKGTIQNMKTQQSISQIEENIAQKISEQERATRKELKSLDDKETEHHMKTQPSISQAEGHIAHKITEDGSETRKLLKSVEEKLTVDVYKIRLLHDELLDTLCKIIESEAFRAKCKNLLLALPGIENMDTEEIMNALHRRGDIGIGDYQKLKEMLDEECNQHIKFTEDAIVNSGGKVYRRGGSGELVEDCSPSRELASILQSRQIKYSKIWLAYPCSAEKSQEYLALVVEMLKSIDEKAMRELPTFISGYPVIVHYADTSEGVEITLRESELMIASIYGQSQTELKMQSSDGKGSVSTMYVTSADKDISQRAYVDTTPDDVMRVVNKYADDLMDKHSNLVGITASYFKSSGFRKRDTSERKLEQKPTIALYCRIKGFIPVNEEWFSAVLDGYETDVREGVVYTATRPKPDEYHSNVRIGCAIGATEVNLSGTLGPFLDIPRYGICAISCAHMFINPSDIDGVIQCQSLKLFRERKNRSNPMSIHQPPSNTRIGCLIEARISRGRSSDGLPGSDCALIKIQNRAPVDGYFPHDEDQYIDRIGVGPFPSYDTGKISREYSDLRGKYVVTYGKETKFSIGIQRMQGITIRPIHSAVSHGAASYILDCQIEVLNVPDNSRKFAQCGDSGAPVFIFSEGQLSTVGLVTAGTSWNTTIVTPIGAVLRSLQLDELTHFMIFNPLPAGHGEEAMEED